MAIPLVAKSYRVCVCVYVYVYIYVVYTFMYSIHTFLYTIFIYLCCNKYVRDPHHTFLVRSILTDCGILATQPLPFQTALSLVLLALSQTVSMLR